MIRIYHVTIIVPKWLCKKPLQPEISPGRPIEDLVVMMKMSGLLIRQFTILSVFAAVTESR
jgi:hypothetical protein